MTHLSFNPLVVVITSRKFNRNPLNILAKQKKYRSHGSEARTDMAKHNASVVVWLRMHKMLRSDHSLWTKQCYVHQGISILIHSRQNYSISTRSIVCTLKYGEINVWHYSDASRMRNTTLIQPGHSLEFISVLVHLLNLFIHSIMTLHSPILSP